jgi:hypothetical protein
MMHSPLKKRPAKTDQQQSKTIASAAAASGTYSGTVQQSTTCTRLIEKPSESSCETTTTTKTRTVTAVLEPRIQAIEREVSSQRASQNWIEERQTKMDNRLHTLESQNFAIGNNITTMMAHWNIPSVPLPSITTPDETMSKVVPSHHTTLTDSEMEDKCF